MVEYVFTPKQCTQLLEAIEKVRSRRVKKRPIDVNVGRWEENSFKLYADATRGRHDMVVDTEGYHFMLTRDGGIEVEVICVHNCGSCVYYVYKATFEAMSPFAREVLALVDTSPDDLDDPYLKYRQGMIFTGLAA
jgi:hypothetical protein